MAKFNKDDQDRREGRSDSNRSNDERRPFYDNVNRNRSEGQPERRERSFDRDERPRRESGDRNERPGFDKPGFDKPRRPFGERRDDNARGERRPFGERRDDNARGERRPFGERRESDFSRGNDRDRGGFGERRSGENRFGGERRFEERGDRPRFGGDRKEGGNRFNRRDDEAGNRFGGERRFNERRDSDRNDKPGFDKPGRPFGERRESGDRNERSGFDKPGFDKPRRPFGERRDDNARGERRPFGERRDDNARGERRPFGERRESGFSRGNDRQRRDEPAWKDPERKSFRWNDDPERKPTDRSDDDRRFNRRDDSERRPYGERRSEGTGRGERRPYGDRNEGARRPFQRDDRNEGSRFDKPRARREDGDRSRPGGPKAPNYDIDRMKERVPEKKQRELERAERSNDGTIRLNRYIANSGICSRRDADVLIANGEIKVNGTVITEMGYKVRPEDTVKYGNRVLNPEKMMYVLLNKPKDYITTTDDPQERHTVMELVKDATPYRIYPVGRLDRNTTGLLLLTNDGELAEKLTHPSNNIRKVYQVEIDKPMTTEHFEQIQEGIELEDGFIKPDDLSIVTPDAQVIGIEIHSGRNRIVRRIFEHFGYEVTKLDRTVYASLNKKDLPRGNWRYLTEKEVIRLKFLL
ncbi:pseudouridine synthase [Tellurirhabdus rosea]|uniref:pseudouridine synthase n=1 Tax=Tellurirhabdus rosea TaxID=2674997 RepID=UPI00224DBFC0|nr:pseudouridine synthase [Tellurirhabdus rosea]